MIGPLACFVHINPGSLLHRRVIVIAIVIPYKHYIIYTVLYDTLYFYHVALCSTLWNIVYYTADGIYSNLLMYWKKKHPLDVWCCCDSATTKSTHSIYMQE